jgi:hypothetical protein
MKQQPKTCAFCGEEFTPERRNGIYCSNTCRQYSYLQRKTGEPYDFPEEQEDEDPVIPALIIEEESDADILSNQHQQKSSIHSFLETEPVKQTPAAMKSEETIRHQLPSNSALPLVLLEIHIRDRNLILFYPAKTTRIYWMMKHSESGRNLTFCGS